MSTRAEREHWFLHIIENPTILVLLVGFAFGYATLSSDVERNAQEITRVQSEIAEKLDDVDAALADQSARFELYLDSLRTVRIENEMSDEELHDALEAIEDRVLLLETEIQKSRI